MNSSVAHEDCDFLSDGIRCAGWLYRPTIANESDVPIVVMAHGFAGERSFRLPAYAKVFAARGIAVLLFDYRHFGDSEGLPRNLVNHRRQHRDWVSAIAHARTIEGIDAQRLGLWGTSFSGGHVISIAAENANVSAIVAQTPMVDMLFALRVDAKFVFAALWHSLWDYSRAIVGRSPHYIPTVAPPSQFAALNRPGCDTGYRALVDDNHKWENKCTARSLLSSLLFRPSRRARSVACPALIIVAEHDQVIRPRAIEKVARRMKRCEVVRCPVDHFGIYQGDVSEQVSRMQADFLALHLNSKNSPPT